MIIQRNTKKSPELTRLLHHRHPTVLSVHRLRVAMGHRHVIPTLVCHLRVLVVTLVHHVGVPEVSVVGMVHLHVLSLCTVVVIVV